MMNQDLVQELFSKVMIEGLGLDLTDPNLIDTPKRFAKMFCNELITNTNNGSEDVSQLIRSFPNEKNYDEIVMLDNIPFVSVCSHHLLPFSGVAYFLYIPDKKLMGASKPARVIDFFSRKLQLQENLSEEIIDEIIKVIQPKGAMLVMRAVHGCMSCRGAKTGTGAGMVTSITRGNFRQLSTRMEAFELIKLSLALKA